MDAVAFDDFVRQHYAGIVAFAASLLGDRGEAEDLAQEVFVVAYRKIDTFDAGRAPGPWLCGIVRRLAMNAVRKRCPLRYLDETALDWLQGIHARAAERHEQTGAERRTALDECLALLGETDRRLIAMKYAENCSYQEIGTQLAASVAAVTKRLYRLRRKLADCVLKRLGVTHDDA